MGGMDGPSSGPSGPGGASAISCMAVACSRGSSSDAIYIITGSGSASDSSLCVLDLRQGGKPAARWAHHRNGIYSLCLGMPYAYVPMLMSMLVCWFL
jgi:hypothetical protein